MEEQIVKFETAKILKEKKFDWKCRGKIHCSHYHLVENNIIPKNVPVYYNDLFAPIENHNRIFLNNTQTFTSLPNQSLVQKWFREVHGIYIMITQEFYKDGVCHLFQVCKYKEGNYTCSGLFGDNGEFIDYEDCLEEGILYALNLI